MFVSVDGRWSRQSREILAALGSDKLDLNSNWASVRWDWACPVCQRRKPQIARLSASGVVMCHLERHHDHLADEGLRVLWRGLPRLADREASRALSSAVTVCRDLSERFFPTLVCKACNLAEGKAKTLLAGVVHPEFSFSPSEIQQFIIIRPRQPHDIDEAVARQIWDEVSEDVHERLAFMSLLSRRIADGRHRREGSPHERSLNMAVLGDVLTASGASGPETIVSQAIARSVQRDGFATSQKPKPTGRVIPPTRAEFEAVVATKSSRDFWHAPPPDWCCAACGRDRFQILRRSPKSGLWTANIHRRRVFSEETRMDAIHWRGGWYRHGLTIRDHEVAYVCQDCRLELTAIRSGAGDFPEDCLSVEGLRALLTDVRPHERPTCDRAQGVRTVHENIEYRDAVASYDSHRAVCLNLRYKASAWRYQASDDQVRTWLMSEIDAPHLREIELPAVLEWLLTEGEAFAEYSRRHRWPREDMGDDEA